MNNELKKKWIEVNDLIEDLWGTPTNNSIMLAKIDLLMQVRNDMNGLIEKQENDISRN